VHRRGDEHVALIDVEFAPQATELMRTLVAPERLWLVEERSSRLAGTTLNARWARQFRWAHIDGEHTGQALVNDLRLANQWIGDDGIICIDDFFNPMYPQLTQAAIQFLDRHPHELTLLLVGFNKGWVCRPLAARAYQDMIRADLARELAVRGLEDITLFKTTEASDMDCFGMGPRFEDYTYRGPDWDPSRIP